MYDKERVKVLIEDIKKSLDTLKEKLVVEDDKVYSQKQFNFEQGSAILLDQIMSTESDLIFLNKGAVEDFIERLKVDSFSKEEGKNPILVHDDDIILIRKKEAYFYKLTDVKKHGGFYSVGNYYKKENLY